MSNIKRTFPIPLGVIDQDTVPRQKSSGMRQINELEAQIGSGTASSDLVPIYQNGITRKATKAQLHTGLPYSDKVITVGAEGMFADPMDAMRHIEKQPQWETITTDGDGAALEASSITWNQGERTLNLTLASGINPFALVFPNDLWIQIDGDTENWCKIEQQWGGNFLLQTKRFTASYSGSGTVALTLKRPIYYTLLFLDDLDSYDTSPESTYTLTVAVNLIITGLHRESKTFGEPQTEYPFKIAWTAADTRHGNIVFDRFQFNSGIGMLQSTSGNEDSTVDLRYFDCIVNYKSTDFQSARNYFGRLEVRRMKTYVSAVVGGTHFWSVGTLGDVIMDDYHIHYKRSSSIGHEHINTLMCDSAFFTNFKVFVDGIVAGQSPNCSLQIFGGMKTVKYAFIENVQIYAVAGNAACECDVIVARGNSQVGDGVWLTHKANGVIDMANVKFHGDWSASVVQLWNTGTLASGFSNVNTTINMRDCGCPQSDTIDETYDTVERYHTNDVVLDHGSAAGILSISLVRADIHKFEAAGNTAVLLTSNTPGLHSTIEISDDGSARQPSLAGAPITLKNGADFAIAASGGGEKMIIKLYTDSDGDTWITSKSEWH